jgi:hypothetical protein
MINPHQSQRIPLYEKLTPLSYVNISNNETRATQHPLVRASHPPTCA